MSSPSLADVPSVSREELVLALRRGRTTLVDVLSPESYAANHIDGVLNLPVAQIASRAATVLPDRGAAVIVYCGGPTWRDGAQAGGRLQELGYRNVRHYAGGLTEWFEHATHDVARPAASSVVSRAPRSAA